MSKHQVINCTHHEKIDRTTNIGTCIHCGQQIQYDFDKPKNTKIIKRGSINGVMTVMHPSSNESTAGPVEEPLPSQAPVPPRPKKRKKLYAYHEENKESIIADYRSMKIIDFFRKWHISSVTWLKLKAKWNLTSNTQLHSAQKRLEKPLETPTKEPIGRIPAMGAITGLAALIHPLNTLPPFPAFRDEWSEAVQVKWLGVYSNLYVLKHQSSTEEPHHLGQCPGS